MMRTPGSCAWRPSAGAAKRTHALLTKPLDEIAEAHDIGMHEHVAAQRRTLCKGGRNEAMVVSRNVARRIDQLRNICEVEESIWSAAETTREFIS